MRTLGIDYGDKRIGLAVSDMLYITSQPLGFIVVNGDKDAILKIKPYIEEYNVEKIVLGLPKNMNGSEGERAIKTRRFSEKLIKAFGMEVVFFDERMTTLSAERTLNSMNIKGSEKKKGKKDMLSAAIILQAYMEINVSTAFRSEDRTD